jgi:hypothetical protein
MPNFRSWFTSTPQVVEDPQKKKELVGFLCDLVLAFVFGVTEMPVMWKWLGWFMCFGIFLFIIQSSIDRLHWLPRKTRIVGAMLLLFGFISVFWYPAHAMWVEEKSALLEGDLIGAGPAMDESIPHGFPMLQVGETVYAMMPGGVANIFPFFPDSGVRIELGRKGQPLFTTHVRDRSGNLIADVTRNHWRVYPLYLAEKNYTKDALEIEDSAGHVVLQVRILRDRIVLQGEWWDTQGNGVRLVGTHAPKPPGSLAIRLSRQSQSNDSLIQPMFEYPSKEHWREFVAP